MRPFIRILGILCCFSILLLWVFVTNMVFANPSSTRIIAPTATSTWYPQAMINSGELRMRRLDDHGIALPDNCVPGDTHYGCTAFCDDFGSTSMPCPDSVVPYPYNSAWPSVSYQDDYLLDVVAQEVSPGLFDVVAMQAQAIAARSYTYYHTGNKLTVNNSVSYHVFIPYKFEYFGQFPNNPLLPCENSGNLSENQRKICEAVRPNYYLSWDDPIDNNTFLPARADYVADMLDRTTSSGDKQYLIGVEDPISNNNPTCSATNASVNTYGMSQNGAQRWITGNQCGATSNGDLPWSVRWTRPEQILFHYYTDVNIRDYNKRIVTALSPANRWNPLKFAGFLDQNNLILVRGTSAPAIVWVQNTGLSNWSCASGVTGYRLQYRWARPGQGPVDGNQGVINCGLAQGQTTWTNVNVENIPNWGYGDYTLQLDMIKMTSAGEERFSPAWATYDRNVYVPPTSLAGGYTLPAPGAEVNYSVGFVAQAGGDGNSAGVNHVWFRADIGGIGWKTVAEDGTDCPVGQYCTYNKPWSLNGIRNGTVITLGFDIEDGAGNRFYTPQGTRQIVIHDDPPSISFIAANGNPAPQIWSNQQQWTFTGTANDPENHLGLIELGCNGDDCGAMHSQTDGNSWIRVQNNLAGQVDIFFAVQDPALNRAESRHLDLRIDLATPSTTVRLNNALPASWYSGTVAVGLNAVDNGTGRATSGISNLTYSMDAQPSQTVYTDHMALSASGEGPHSIQAYAMDQVGNQEGPKTFNFNIDDTRPVVRAMSVITDGQGKGDCPFITGTVWLTLEATDSGSGVQALRLSNDGTNWSEWQPYLSRILWTLPSTSTVNQVYVQARDRVGWVSETYSQSLQWVPSNIWCRYLPAIFRQR